MNFFNSKVAPLEAGRPTYEEQSTYSEKNWRKHYKKFMILSLAIFILGIVMLVQGTAADCPEKKKAKQNVGEDTKEICCYHNMFGRYVREDCPSTSGDNADGGCFAPGSLVVLENNVVAKIEDMQLGDVLVDGGVVESVMQVWGESEPLYDIDGIVVSGSHAVRDPYDLVWKRVIDVEVKNRVLQTNSILWNLVTSDHRLVLQKPNDEGNLLAADYMEADETSGMREASLRYLNNDIYDIKDELVVEADEDGRISPPRHLKACFPPGTLIVLEDGISTVTIDEVQVGSYIAGGGLVQSVMKLMGEHEPLYDVEGVVISEAHSVLDPTDKVWRHAKDVLKAKKLDYVSHVLFNLITEHHRMFVTSTNNIHVEVADFLELDEDDELLDWNLLQLNNQEESGSWQL